MGVYIKNMQKPKNCTVCEIRHLIDCKPYQGLEPPTECPPHCPLVEVVECKDCKYAEIYYGFYTQICCENGVIGGHGELWNPDDFCSYGERSKE